MSKAFREKLSKRHPLLGTMVTLPSTAVAELLSKVGFDWLFIDAEHGPLGRSELQAMIQAIDQRAVSLVRVPTLSEEWIKSVLDIGANGIIVPQVNTADEAQLAVKWSKYAPLGARGVGLARAHGYGLSFAEYMETANESTIVVVQAESKQSVENIDSIVQVPGVDAIMIGPYDLSASMGLMGQVDHPEVVAAIDRIATACFNANIPVGFFGVSADSVLPAMERGISLIVAGVDTLLLGQSAQRMLQRLQSED